MGLQFGLQSQDICYKKKHRWMFATEEDLDEVGQFPIVPCSKGARPRLQFKETEVAHLTETFYFPTKPEWQTIEITFYDLRKNINNVYRWLSRLYQPKNGVFKPIINSLEFTDNLGISTSARPFKRTGLLELYSGCGEILESWTLENCYPQTIDFGDLDMASSDLVYIDVTLRYDRAYMNN